HPEVIDVGLLPALHSQAAYYRDHFEAVVRADARVRRLDQVRENRIPVSVRLAVYRVVEEALANAAHHAGADRVEVELSVVAAEGGRDRGECGRQGDAGRLPPAPAAAPGPGPVELRVTVE